MIFNYLVNLQGYAVGCRGFLIVAQGRYRQLAKLSKQAQRCFVLRIRDRQPIRKILAQRYRNFDEVFC